MSFGGPHLKYLSLQRIQPPFPADPGQEKWKTVHRINGYIGGVTGFHYEDTETKLVQ